MEASKPKRRLVDLIPEAPEIQKITVWHFTEKKTDVNLATDMLTDALKNNCDQIVLCSNDSDLEAALARIKEHSTVKIGLVAPISGEENRRISTDLKKYADWSKILSTSHLGNAQLPEKIPGQSKPIIKPEAW
jgi:uncharacterized LabA/DUF88 family protein